MVGTFRSAGCAICRKRKKKCGEELPECSLCAKAGWTCPGYTTRWRFVDENRPLSLLYRKKKYIFEDVDRTDDVDGASVDSLLVKLESSTSNGVSAIGFSLTLPCQQTCSTLCYILEDAHCRAGFPVKAHGSFYGMIPARLGRLSVLDDAVTSLCSLYTDSFRGTKEASDRSIRLYAQSLQTLRKCLVEPQNRTAAETICASIILQLCELIMQEKGGRWEQLCQGTRLLMQEAGPEQFVEPFEWAMLESQRAWFIVQDASTRRECFLSRPEWRSLLSLTRPAFEDEPLSISLRAQLCEFLVDAPELLRSASEIAAHMTSSSDPPSELVVRRNRMIYQISSVKQTLECWYSTNVIPIRPVYDDNELQVTHSEDKENQDILAAVIDCVSNSALIRLDMVLSSLIGNSTEGKLGSFSQHDMMIRRQAAMYESLNWVRGKSSVAAKPLEFGLQQLWFEAGLDTNEASSCSRPFFRGPLTPRMLEDP